MSLQMLTVQKQIQGTTLGGEGTSQSMSPHLSQTPCAKALCGGLDENAQRLLCLNTWTPVGGSVWERLEGVGLLEDAVCHLRQTLRFQKLTHSQSLFLSLLVDQM